MYMNEGNMATAFMGAFGLFFLFLWVVLLVLWIILPFYIFGIKGLIKEMLEEQKKTNEFLKDILYKKIAADTTSSKPQKAEQD